jgi:peptidoglycan/LPS O-acetylase OafA/YrhL
MTVIAPALPVTTPGDRLAGLDGLRAVAVTLVILFHLGPGVLLGGYVGVDVFFPISGFLITTLLLRERASTGRIAIPAFWRRRARRLLPALGVLLLVCCGAAFVVGGDVRVELGRQVLGATTFSYNWLAVADGSAYLDATTPELFRNLWSLAVEEQFYLVWPLLLIAVWLVPSRRFRVVFVLAVAVASAVAMAMLASTGATTRLYYGTDTHSFGLALGAAYAIARHEWPGFGIPRRRLTRALAGVGGVLAIAGLLTMAFLLPEDGEAMYLGGLALVAVLTMAAVAAATVPGSVLGRVLDVQPLRWIGERSYGLYLWHWPVFVLVTAALPLWERTGAGGWALGGIAFAITLVAAALSYRYVETPFRRNGLRASLRVFTGQWRSDMWGVRRGAFVRATLVSLAAVCATALTVGAVASDPGTGEAETRISAGQALIDAEPTPAAPAPTPTADAPPAVPSGDQVVAIGDSVMLAVAPELTQAFPGIYIDAVVSRQMSSAPAIVQSLVDQGAMRPYLVLGLGTNGSISADTLSEVKKIVGSRTRIVLVNVQAPRGWTEGVNGILTDYAARMPHVQLANWHDAIQPHMSALAADQIHAGGPVGGGIYVEAVSAAMLELAGEPTIDRGPNFFGDEQPGTK